MGGQVNLHSVGVGNKSLELDFEAKFQRMRRRQACKVLEEQRTPEVSSPVAEKENLSEANVATAASLWGKDLR